MDQTYDDDNFVWLLLLLIILMCHIFLNFFESLMKNGNKSSVDKIVRADRMQNQRHWFD